MTISPRPTPPKQTPYITTSVLDAASMLKQGKLLAYPTESVWGIGCDAYDEQAVQRILTIKQRPIDKGMIVITDHSERLASLLANLTAGQRQRVLASWETDDQQACQQAHTWLLPLAPLTSNKQTLGRETGDATVIPSWITGRHKSVAVRVIAHPLIKQLCAQMVSAANPYGFMVSTSCNPSGELPARNLKQAYDYFADEIGYLNAPTLGYTKPSQIRDALTGKILR